MGSYTNVVLCGYYNRNTPIKLYDAYYNLVKKPFSGKCSACSIPQ